MEPALGVEGLRRRALSVIQGCRIAEGWRRHNLSSFQRRARAKSAERERLIVEAVMECRARCHQGSRSSMDREKGPPSFPPRCRGCGLVADVACVGSAMTSLPLISF